MLLPHHPPELPERLREGSLSGDVGILTAVAINIVSVDVVTAWDTCIIRRKWKLRRVEGEKKTERGVCKVRRRMNCDGSRLERKGRINRREQ